LGNEISIHRGEREPSGRAELFVVKRFGTECRSYGAGRTGTSHWIVLSGEDDDAGRGWLRDAARFARFSGSAASAASGARVSSAAAACQSSAGLAATNWLGSSLGRLSSIT